MGFGVQGLGFGIQGSGFGFWGSGFGVWGSGFGVQGSGFRVQGSGCRVQGVRFGVWGSGFVVWGAGLRGRPLGAGARREDHIQQQEHRLACPLCSFCKSQFPHRSINLFFVLVIKNDTLTNLWGNRLLQNDFSTTSSTRNTDLPARSAWRRLYEKRTELKPFWQ